VQYVLPPPLALDPTSLALSSTLAVSGNVQYVLPPLSLNPTSLALSSVLGVSGNIQFTPPGVLALSSSAVALSSTLAVSGNVQYVLPPPLVLNPTSLTLSSTLAVSGNVQYVLPPLVLNPSSLVLSSTLAVFGNLQFNDGSLNRLIFNAVKVPWAGTAFSNKMPYMKRSLMQPAIKKIVTDDRPYYELDCTPNLRESEVLTGTGTATILPITDPPLTLVSITLTGQSFVFRLSGGRVRVGQKHADYRVTLSSATSLSTKVSNNFVVRVLE
jgi:hypothetical protein